jgi:hypothetical protein
MSKEGEIFVQVVPGKRPANDPLKDGAPKNYIIWITDLIVDVNASS